MNGVSAIRAERQRQIEAEGFTLEHDAQHEGGELALAAATYAWVSAHAHTPDEFRAEIVDASWPWSPEDFKPVDRMTALVKAGALIAAEIDRVIAVHARRAGERTALNDKLAERRRIEQAREWEKRRLCGECGDPIAEHDELCPPEEVPQGPPSPPPPPPGRAWA